MNWLPLKRLFKYLALSMMLVSCSSFEPRSVNEYTVTKKSPLLIPPDMDMVPPLTKNANIITKDKNSIYKSENSNLEDILTEELKINNGKKVKIKKKILRKKIVKDILRMKESIILK